MIQFNGGTASNNCIITRYTRNVIIYSSMCITLPGIRLGCSMQCIPGICIPGIHLFTSCKTLDEILHCSNLPLKKLFFVCNAMDNCCKTSFIVTAEDTGARLFKCCHKYCSSLSISQLRSVFANKGVCVNGVVYEKEVTRVTEGDNVDIFHVHDSIDSPEELNKAVLVVKPCVVFQNSRVSIFEKASGVNSAVRGEYDLALRGQAGGQGAGVPFRLPKYMHGLCMAIKCPEDLSKMLCAVRKGDVSFVFTCVVAERVGDVGSTVWVPLSPGAGETDLTAGSCSDVYAGYEATVLSVSECRFSYFVSLIEVRPIVKGDASPGPPCRQTENGSTLSTGVPVPIPVHVQKAPALADVQALTGAVRRLRVDLHRAGFRVVGDGNCVKASKGIFMVLSALQVKDPYWLCDDGDNKLDTPPQGWECGSAAGTFVLKMNIPTKFGQLINRERFLYLRAAERSAGLVDEWLGLYPAQEDRCERVGRMVELLAQSGKVSAAEVISLLAVEEGGPTAASFRALCCRLHTQLSLPVEYLLGEAAFCGTRYAVSPHVMIPRRSSECLVEAALNEVATVGGNSRLDSQGLSVLDMGTGSGCLLLSFVRGAGVACGRAGTSTAPVRFAMGSDISPDALSVARSNANGIADSTEHLCFVQSRFSQLPELADALPEGLCQSTQPWNGFDVVLCNPPYSTLHDNSRISRQALEMEPSLALVTENAFGAYKELAAAFNSICVTTLRDYGDKSIEYLSGIVHSGTIVVLEIGAGQHDAVREIFDTVPILEFQRYILDYNQLTRGLLYRFV